MVKCEKCGKEFETRRANQGHQRMHLNILKYRCYFCGGKVELRDRDKRLVKTHEWQGIATYARCVEEKVWWVMEEFGRLTIREK